MFPQSEKWRGHWTLKPIDQFQWDLFSGVDPEGKIEDKYGKSLWKKKQWWKFEEKRKVELLNTQHCKVGYADGSVVEGSFVNDIYNQSENWKLNLTDFKGALDKFNICIFICSTIEDFKSNQYRKFQLILPMSFHFMRYFVNSIIFRVSHRLLYCVFIEVDFEK